MGLRLFGGGEGLLQGGKGAFRQVDGAGGIGEQGFGAVGVAAGEDMVPFGVTGVPAAGKEPFGVGDLNGGKAERFGDLAEGGKDAHAVSVDVGGVAKAAVAGGKGRGVIDGKGSGIGEQAGDAPGYGVLGVHQQLRTEDILPVEDGGQSGIDLLAGGFGGASAATSSQEGPEGTMKETTADDVAVQLVYAEKVIFVPGFGLAQAQAQRELADLGELLKAHGVEVSYAIHPVAGRMPGHMNVLLAEANVPYDELVDLDDINPQFSSANVALVVGANDVTNPAARRPGTPVSGMPILDVDQAQHVVVMKRGRGRGYAGIENELYFEDNTQMLFGDAKAGLQAVIAAVKELLA